MEPVCGGAIMAGAIEHPRHTPQRVITYAHRDSSPFRCVDKKRNG